MGSRQRQTRQGVEINARLPSENEKTLVSTSFFSPIAATVGLDFTLPISLTCPPCGNAPASMTLRGASTIDTARSPEAARILIANKSSVSFFLSQKMERMPQMKNFGISSPAWRCCSSPAATSVAGQHPLGLFGQLDKHQQQQQADADVVDRCQGSSGVASGNSGIIIYNLTTRAVPSVRHGQFLQRAVQLGSHVDRYQGDQQLVADRPFLRLGEFHRTLFKASNVTTKSLLPGVTTWTSPTTAQVTLGAGDTG